MVTEKEILLLALDDAFDGAAWHGPTLFGTLGALNLVQAVFANTFGGYSPWQIALHCAYWKWMTRKNLSELDIGVNPRLTRDWPPLPVELTKRNWEADLELLKSEHEKLKQAILDFPVKRFGETKDGTPFHFVKSINCIAAHDVYHTAQIRNIGVPEIA